EPTSNPKLHLSPAHTTPANLSGLKRLNSLLLPIPYGDKFYKDIVSSPSSGALTRVAFWDGGIGVVGGVRARLELDNDGPADGKTKVYIMTLCTLSPFRRLGVGGALLQHVIATARKLGASEVYAHVWEQNTDALAWYESKGFEVDENVLAAYYRKLRPAGARVVR
ncbi:N-alpha-acetyltransferase 50, NatE catalytic subunit, partial [Geopyxis carbonaria]